MKMGILPIELQGPRNPSCQKLKGGAWDLSSSVGLCRHRGISDAVHPCPCAQQPVEHKHKFELEQAIQAPAPFHMGSGTDSIPGSGAEPLPSLAFFPLPQSHNARMFLVGARCMSSWLLRGNSTHLTPKEGIGGFLLREADVRVSAVCGRLGPLQRRNTEIHHSALLTRG